ncbi:hypothetical protein [Thiobacillus sp.]|uniref:hypothetical protein n=1 Tax=Thiobacillus sp. TaxID=924 RepID=UPI0025ED6FFB|nr:hypothetical protein [Thiobacillus sp.]MBT9538409.1 hypothetical protein [Thiobacillus sp.]
MTHAHSQASLLFILLAAGLSLSGCLSTETRPTEAAPTATSAAPAEAAPQPAAAQTPVCKDTAPAKSSKKNSKTKAKPTQDPACVKPAPTAAKPATVAVAAGGYDLSKNTPVTDSSKVEAGQGTQVKGINDWQGEITGVPVKGSRFTKLKIGMPMQQVFDLVGQPTDQGAYVTGKAFIPFYFGSDTTRWEATYKGQGRLIFSNQAGFSSGQYLTWIIYNSNEPGYR